MSFSWTASEQIHENQECKIAVFQWVQGRREIWFSVIHYDPLDFAHLVVLSLAVQNQAWKPSCTAR